MDPQELRRLVRKWALLVLALGTVGAVAAFGVSKALTPVYEADGRLLVLAAPQQQSPSNAFSATTSQVTSTYASLMTTNPVLLEVIHDLDLPENPEQLAPHIKITPERDTQILQVAVSDPSPERATDIANTLMKDFVSHVAKQHQDQIAQAGAELKLQEKRAQDDLAAAEQGLAADRAGDRNDPGILTERIKDDRDLLNQLITAYSTSSATQSLHQDNVTPASPARLPAAPASPRVVLNTGLGGVAGLLVGVGLVLLLEYLDQGLRSEEDVRRRLGATTLGVVPSFSPSAGGSVRDRRRNEHAAEAYRRLRTNLRFCAVDRPIRSVVITSSRQGEGKTSTSANLARIVAASGQRVLLVDADMRRPNQHLLFSKPLLNGMSELLLGAAHGSLASMNGSHHTDHRNLSLLTAGVIPPNPAELLASRHAPEVLRHLEAQNDLVVMDTPPVDVVTDALALAGTADATILVVRAGSSARQVERTMEALRRVNATVVGIVLNRARDDKATGYYYYEGYYTPQRAPKGRAHRVNEVNGQDTSAWRPIIRQGPTGAPATQPPPSRVSGGR